MYFKAEEGGESQPYDMVIYEKPEASWQLMTNFLQIKRMQSMTFRLITIYCIFILNAALGSLFSFPKLRLIISSCECYIIYSECCFYMISSKQSKQTLV